MAGEWCEVCGFVFATRTDDENHPDGAPTALCWQRVHGACLQEPIDWRARALAAEADLAAALSRAATAEGRVERLTKALVVARDMLAGLKQYGRGCTDHDCDAHPDEGTLRAIGAALEGK